MNPNSASESTKYVEDTGKPWTSQYNHQKRPDQQSRLKAVLPMDRLTQKKGRQFTTDTSRAARLAQLNYQDDLKAQVGKSSEKSNDNSMVLVNGMVESKKNTADTTSTAVQTNNKSQMVAQDASSAKKKYLPVNYSKK